MITLLQPAYCDGRLGPDQRYNNYHFCKKGFQELPDPERIYLEHLQMEATVKKVSLQEFEEWKRRENQRNNPVATTRRSLVIATVVSTMIFQEEMKDSRDPTQEGLFTPIPQVDQFNSTLLTAEIETGK